MPSNITSAALQPQVHGNGSCQIQTSSKHWSGERNTSPIELSATAQVPLHKTLSLIPQFVSHEGFTRVPFCSQGPRSEIVSWWASRRQTFSKGQPSTPPIPTFLASGKGVAAHRLKLAFIPPLAVQPRLHVNCRMHKGT